MYFRTDGRSLLRIGTAVATVLFFSSQTAQAQVFVARCNMLEGPGVYRTGISVWINRERIHVPIGERGLTRAIAFSPERLLAWFRSEFQISPLMQVGFNDCMGSQLAPQAAQPQMSEDSNPDAFDPPPPPPKPHDDSDCGECGPSCRG